MNKQTFERKIKKLIRNKFYNWLVLLPGSHFDDISDAIIKLIIDSLPKKCETGDKFSAGEQWHIAGWNDYRQEIINMLEEK